MAGQIYNTGRIGRETELKAWLWLTRNGYDVFDNIFPNGPIDIVAVNTRNGLVLKLEVRTGTIGPNGVYHSRLDQRQVDLGVQLLLYRPDLDDFEIVPLERAKPVIRKLSVHRSPEHAASERAKRNAALDGAERRQESLKAALRAARPITGNLR